MKTFPIKKAMAAALLASMLFTGCAQKQASAPVKNDTDVKTEINLNEVASKSFNEDKMNAEYSRYSFDLMAQVAAKVKKNCNIMISPASIMMALDMCAAGAKGETLKQLTDLFAKDEDPLEQQAFAADLMKKINNAGKVEFACANAIWTNESIMGNNMNSEYRNYIRKTFDAEFRSVKFGPVTHEEINKWVEDKTNHMIKDVVPELDPATVMVLVNAIRFEAKWANPYKDSDISNLVFHGVDGDKTTPMLSSKEKDYFQTAKATGFIKYYEDNDYAFLAILPADEKANANEFIKTFTYNDYKKFVNSRKSVSVHAIMPEFKSDFEQVMNDELKGLGATDAFNPNKADFTGIANSVNGRIFISQVIHKTHIEVDRKGTKAAAATVIITKYNGAVTGRFETVICDRPFVYAIVNVKTMNPVFIGTVNNV